MPCQKYRHKPNPCEPYKKPIQTKKCIEKATLQTFRSRFFQQKYQTMQLVVCGDAGSAAVPSYVPYNNSKLNAHNSTYSFSNLIKIYSHLNLHFYDRLTNTPSTPIIKITHWLRNKRKRHHCIKINSDGDIQSNQRHISDPQYTFICYLTN